MRVWGCNKFKGHYPVGVAAVVVAETAEQAAFYLGEILESRGLEQPEAIDPDDMQELPLEDGQYLILCDGNY